MTTTTTETLSTGLPELDAVLGVGGWPRGRICEVFTRTGVDLTTVGVQACAAAQRAGETAAYVDLSHELEAGALEATGVDAGSLLVSQPNDATQALEVATALARSGAVALVVVDLGELDLEPLERRAMSQALRALTAIGDRTRTAVLVLHRPRLREGVTFGQPWGALPDALRFYASIRAELYATDEGVVARVRKNKLGPVFVTSAPLEIPRR